MSKGTKLVGPWRNIHGAVWLIGLAILFWTGWWWPGILILVGISALVEAVIQIAVPEAVGPQPEPEPARPESEPEEEAPAPAPSVAAASARSRSAELTPKPDFRYDLLPARCPGCGAPVRGHEVEWTGPQSADCQYCGTSLPMRQA
jgi:hypothetical protein